MATATDSPAAPLVLYDGDCGFCHRSIEFILRHERSAVLTFAALHSDLGRAELVRHGLPADFYRSIVLIEDGVAYRYSTAALRVSRYLKSPWRWAWALRLFPAFLRDAAYRFVANNRGKIGSGPKNCVLPTNTTRRRFLM
ncbi:MAG: DCC1-like thiol-disulfide oxidoreductase family protein [Tepidisphaeraceae bacterium]